MSAGGAMADFLHSWIHKRLISGRSERGLAFTSMADETPAIEHRKEKAGGMIKKE